MQNPGDYGIKVKYFRKRAKLSQFELEIKTGLANGTVCRIEKGLTNPSKETLQKISEALFLSPFEIAYLYGIDLNQLLKTRNELVLNVLNEVIEF